MINLNKHQMALLPALYALLTEKNVSKAASRMNLTQPAMSKILTQLRTQFNDELLVRCAKQYLLTTRAEQVLSELHHLMPQIESIWKPAILNLDTVDKKISLSGTDMDIMVASKALMTIVNSAKHLQLTISSSHEYSVEDLLQGKIDFLFTAFNSDHSGLYRKLWLQSEYVFVSHKDNARVKSTMMLQDYLDLPHIAFQLSNSNQTAVDIALKALGHQRKISLWVPTFVQAVAFIKAQPSDFVLAIPRVFVEYLDDIQSLTISALPFDIEPLQIYFYWHKKGHNDSLNKWIRGIIFDRG
ncbi:MAG: LysR family transcriptional regulator [Psychrosphaera sp.]|nr:LysR family transcriptional regulator [Psychrosphaera sp.]